MERGPELVCQAIRLINRGALDGRTEQQLGEVLGVSGRHLRRLFLEHLGCTPDQLARSTRAHFARRLLDDTDGGLCLRLPFQPPLAWPVMPRHLRQRAIPGVEHVTETSYQRTIVIEGDPGALELHSPGGHSGPTRPPT